MLPASTVRLFVVAALALLVLPGPAVLYITTRSLAHGRRAGLVSVAGIQLGSLAHVLAATLGVSALLMTSAAAFSLVKYAGAAYLVYLGLRALRTHAEDGGLSGAPPRTLSQLFAQGVLVNVLNPKTALFFFAFLPQFVDPARGAAAGQIFRLGLLFVALACCTDSAYALLASTLGGWLRRSSRFEQARRYVTGIVFIGLGLTAAVAGETRK